MQGGFLVKPEHRADMSWRDEDGRLCAASLAQGKRAVYKRERANVRRELEAVVYGLMSPEDVAGGVVRLRTPQDFRGMYINLTRPSQKTQPDVRALADAVLERHRGRSNRRLKLARKRAALRHRALETALRSSGSFFGADTKRALRIAA